MYKAFKSHVATWQPWVFFSDSADFVLHKHLYSVRAFQRTQGDTNISHWLSDIKCETKDKRVREMTRQKAEY